MGDLYTGPIKNSNVKDIRKVVDVYNSKFDEWISTKELEQQAIAMLKETGLVSQIPNIIESIFEAAGQGLKGAGRDADSSFASILSNATTFAQDFEWVYANTENGRPKLEDISNLAGSQLGIINGFYDFLEALSDDEEFKLFKDNSVVQSIGVLSETFKLMSSIMSASSSIDEKDFSERTDDYTNVAKNLSNLSKEIVSILDDSPKRLGLFWNDTTGNFAIVSGVIEGVGQLTKDFERYGKDGWEAEEVLHTALGADLGFLYGMARKLSFGLDKVIYGVIDKATGGNGETDMSYLEKAIEGYKMFISDPVGSLTNLWKKIEEMYTDRKVFGKSFISFPLCLIRLCRLQRRHNNIHQSNLKS